MAAPLSAPVRSRIYEHFAVGVTADDVVRLEELDPEVVIAEMETWKKLRALRGGTTVAIADIQRSLVALGAQVEASELATADADRIAREAAAAIGALRDRVVAVEGMVTDNMNALAVRVRALEAAWYARLLK